MKKKLRQRSLLSWVKVLFETLLILLILLSPYISPVTNSWLAIFSFSVPLIPIWLLGRAIYQYFRKDGYYLVFVTLLLITLLIFGPRLFALNIMSDGGDKALKVMSFNLSAFKANGTSDIDEQSAAFLKFLNEEKIDVLCFQEFSFVTKNLKEELSKLGYDFVQFKNPKNEKIKLRTLIFSRHEILQSRLIRNGITPAGVFATINFNGDTVSFVSTHIKSYNVKASHPLNSSTFSKVLNSIRYIIHRLKVNSIQQIEQVKTILAQTNNSSEIIVCGDFNSIPSNYIYGLMKRSYDNAFEEAGNGFGVTYLGKTLFFLRIDHQFYGGDKLKAIEVTTHDFGFSDHRAVYGKYDLSN